MDSHTLVWPLELGIRSEWCIRVAQSRLLGDRMAHFADSMPISSIGGMWFVDLWNPKYAAHIFKVTVAFDMLGNVV